MKKKGISIWQNNSQINDYCFELLFSNRANQPSNQPQAHLLKNPQQCSVLIGMRILRKQLGTKQR